MKIKANKKILKALYENYDSMDLQSAIAHFDSIRAIVESDADFRNELREDLISLHSGVANLLGNNFFDRPTENLGDLANDIDDRLFDIIEAAEKIRRLLNPIMLLSVESDQECESYIAQIEEYGEKGPSY